jgi:dienelactone hydrolase
MCALAQTEKTATPSHRDLLTTLLVLIALTSNPAQAAIVEDIVTIPVTVRDIYGHELSHDITVTVFHDDARQKSPFLVLSHGRPANNTENLRMGRQRYTANSRYFVEQGFAVLVPTRIGYGVTGGPDAEYSGNDCRNRLFAGAVGVAIDQIAATIKYAKTLPYVDASRGIAVGQSAGGIATVGVTARNIAGLTAAVNFSGGNGGNPETSPENPCSPGVIEGLYRQWGRQEKIPTLWLYSENDKFWGPRLPHAWFDAFTSNGGKGSFVQLPPYAQNGHSIFTGNPEAWKPAFETFIHGVGF